MYIHSLISFVFLFPSALVRAIPIAIRTMTGVDFIHPTLHGGSWLVNIGSGGGEPLDVIISGLSSPEVLTNDGFANYSQAIGFSEECLGLRIGNTFSENLGDGHGAVAQSAELREDFDIPDLGTCLESGIGGNHIRVFRQNGPDANTGALFLAVLREHDIFQHHNIVEDGYNKGQDELANMVQDTHSCNGVKYITTVTPLPNQMPSGSAGIK